MYRTKRSAFFLCLLALLSILGNVRAYEKNHLHNQRHADHIDQHMNHDDHGGYDYDDDFDHDDYDQDLEDLHNHSAKEIRQDKGDRMRVPYYRATTSLHKRKWNPTSVKDFLLKVVNQAPFQKFKRKRHAVLVCRVLVFEISKKRLETCAFLCIFGQFWRFPPVYELVYCVRRPNTFCVATPAFYHNMPTLEAWVASAF